MRIGIDKLEEIIEFAKIKKVKEVNIETLTKYMGMNEIENILEVDFGDDTKLRYE